MIFAILSGYIISIIWIWRHSGRIDDNQKIYIFLNRLPHSALKCLRFISIINIILSAWLLFNYPTLHLKTFFKYVIYVGVALFEYLISLIHFYILRIIEKRNKH